jgi:hypothetical protein
VRTTLFLALLSLALAVPAFAQKPAAPAWSMNATAIEACSCPMFCQCYFNAGPAGRAAMAGMEGHSEHYCKFNNAYKVNKGAYGAANWTAPRILDLRRSRRRLQQGQMSWAVLTFDKATTREQREGIGAICGKLFPVTWKSFQHGRWRHLVDGRQRRAHAMLDGGKTAEVQLSTASLN